MTSLCTLIFLSWLITKSLSAKDTINVTKFLKDPETITSENNIFSLGFFSPLNSTKRYVGIWYNKPSVRDVIWVANRNNPLNDSSGVFKISKDGNLQVHNSKNEIFWSSNVSGLLAGVDLSTAQLLDSGNLVLQSLGDMVWQSFDHPTDSFLPNMKLTIAKIGNQKQPLQSWKSPSDPSDGQFIAGIDTSTIPELAVWDGHRLHWRGGPWNGNYFIGVQFNFIDFINAQLVVSSDEGTVTAAYFYPNTSLLSTYMLSTNGKLAQIWWDDGKRKWEVEWKVPATECDVYGKCGAFGTCNPRRPVICQCLKGFEPKNEAEWSRGNWSNGCFRKTKLQCEIGKGGKGDGFLRLKKMKVPYKAEWRPGLTQDVCRTQCLNNCSCLAYVYETGLGCMTWSTSLIDIQEFSVGGMDIYLRLAHSELDADNKIKTIAAIMGSFVGITAISALLCFLWRQRVHQEDDKEMEESYMINGKKRKVKLGDVHLYKFETLAAATNNFQESNKLGRGGFGSVYKGKLEDGQEIAVKRLSGASTQGLEEFMNEVKVISKLQHRNLVRLLGCSVEGKEKMLVYEYMPNKSLDAFLFVEEKQKDLDWNKRFNIIKGICTGLQYLHRDSRLRIIHRDLKVSNILLDQELNPKISDFGMARIFGGDQYEADTRRVVGTYGYMSPEYAMEGLFSEKSDVYSFGVILLEILSGKRNNLSSDEEHYSSLLGYAWRLWNEKNIMSFIDPAISASHHEKDIMMCIHVGLLCVQAFARDRPDVPTVISMLNGEVSDLSCPKVPGSAYISQDNAFSQQDSTKNYATITEISGR